MNNIWSLGSYPVIFSPLSLLPHRRFVLLIHKCVRQLKKDMSNHGNHGYLYSVPDFLSIAINCIGGNEKKNIVTEK